jgi:hypothetical protein
VNCVVDKHSAVVAANVLLFLWRWWSTRRSKHPCFSCSQQNNTEQQVPNNENNMLSSPCYEYIYMLRWEDNGAFLFYFLSFRRKMMGVDVHGGRTDSLKVLRVPPVRGMIRLVPYSDSDSILLDFVVGSSFILNQKRNSKQASSNGLFSVQSSNACCTAVRAERFWGRLETNPLENFRDGGGQETSGY